MPELRQEQVREKDGSKVFIRIGLVEQVNSAFFF